MILLVNLKINVEYQDQNSVKEILMMIATNAILSCDDDLNDFHF